LTAAEAGGDERRPVSHIQLNHKNEKRASTMNKLITIAMACLLAACGGNAAKPLVNSPAEGVPASSQASSLQRYQTFNLVPWPAYVVDKADELGEQGFLSFSPKVALSVDAAAFNSAASIASLLNDLNIGIDEAA